MRPEKFENSPSKPETQQKPADIPEIVPNVTEEITLNMMEAKKEKKVEEKERYNPSEKEKYWQDFWERERLYEFNPEQSGPLYTVDTPPPTISGALHLGHVFSYTQAEVIARFKRMEGQNVRYPMGLDNNGLPTERLTEKEIGIKGEKMGLEEFIKSCLDITEKYTKIYENLWRSLGLSVDWRLEYSTISPEVQKIGPIGIQGAL